MTISKRQIKPSMNNLLEHNNIQICLLSPNTTDHYQPLDIAVSKPAKRIIKKKFELWFAAREASRTAGWERL